MIEGTIKLTNGQTVMFHTETWTELFRRVESWDILSIEAKQVDLQHFRQGRYN